MNHHPAAIFGVGLYGTDSAREAVDLARQADRLGYARFWIGDSHMIWRELYVLAGAIAQATRAIAIGPGVTHGAGRHITVTASAMATLHELTGARVFLGFGVGASGPANIAMAPLSPADLTEQLKQLQALLRGQAVEIAGRPVRCLFARGEIPIFIGTRAPEVMKIACRLTSGFIHAGESSHLHELVRRIAGYAADAGRHPGDVQFIYRVPCAVDDDPERAREAVKGVVARTAMTQLGRLYDRGRLENDADRRAVERIRREYDTYRHMDAAHSHLVRDEWIDRFALAGTAEQARDRVRGLIAAGIDELTIIPCGDSRKTVIEAFAREVMDKL